MKTFKLTKTNVLCVLLFVSFFGIGQELETSVFVTGNTGAATDTSVLSQINEEAKTVGNSKLLILGNSVSKEGFSKDEKGKLTAQLEALTSFKGTIVFTPGQHEWANNGHKGVKDRFDHNGNYKLWN